MSLPRLLLAIILSAPTSLCRSQQADSAGNDLSSIAGKYYSGISKKFNSIGEHLTRKSLKYLEKFERHERKISQMLNTLDSNRAATLSGSEDQFDQFRNQIKSRITKISGGRREYHPYLDTLATSLSFLKKSNTNVAVARSAEDVASLQNKLYQSEAIKQFIAEKKQQIREQLSRYTKLPAGLSREYGKLSKTAYYYSAQVQEYKDMLKDPSKIERKALTLLNKLPAFQKFMSKNSQLAAMFRQTNSGISASRSLGSLQTRASVQELIQAQVPAGNANFQQMIRQNVNEAQSELSQLKNKLNIHGAGTGGNVEMPDFKPNNQKTKTFRHRLQYGADIQFGKSTGFVPNSTNIGLTLGYKLNDKSIIGVGASYKMGMGTLRHITFSHQGFGVRTFADYKLKQSLFISGGYEMNYNAAFRNIEQLKDLNAWQSSGLFGISKKYRVKPKVTGEMKLLYDFLANEHKPASQPILFRLGYNLK